MSTTEFDPIKGIQELIDSAVNATGEDLDLSMAPPFVSGMDLTGLLFTRVAVGEFDMVWTVEHHLTHYDGMVQGGVVNVIADTGQSFAYATTSTVAEVFSTAEFTTRFSVL
jgi:acyl-coenzyme A thioesterase PaaI-like protein